MAEEQKKREVLVSELALSVGYQLEALIRLLERKGVLSREEVLSEIQQMQEESRRGPAT